ncbi:uncharacterized protein LOC144209479 isoform X1 [Stigmatopora nigra]
MYYPAPGFKERAVSLEQGIKQKVLRADGDVWRKMSCSRMGFFFSPFSGDDVATVAAGGPSSCFVPLCCVVEPPGSPKCSHAGLWSISLLKGEPLMHTDKLGGGPHPGQNFWDFFPTNFFCIVVLFLLWERHMLAPSRPGRGADAGSSETEGRAHFRGGQISTTGGTVW